MQVLFSSFCSNSPGNLGFIYTLWKKGGNIVLFWVAVRVVKCPQIFTNHFVSEGGQRGDKNFLPVTQSVMPFSFTNIFI